MLKHLEKLNKLKEFRIVALLRSGYPKRFLKGHNTEFVEVKKNPLQLKLKALKTSLFLNQPYVSP